MAKEKKVAMCLSCGSANDYNSDIFIQQGADAGVCKFCGGPTRGVKASDYKKARDIIRQPGRRQGGF